jgi:hypothetical protein
MDTERVFICFGASTIKADLKNLFAIAYLTVDKIH